MKRRIITSCVSSILQTAMELQSADISTGDYFVTELPDSSRLMDEIL